jgi:TonB family protein
MQGPARKRRDTKPVLWAALLAALVTHFAALASIEIFGIEAFGHLAMSDADAAAARAGEPDVELQSSCTGDVILATSARAVMCLAPWSTDVANCSDEVQTQMWMDLSGCMARSLDSVAAVAMVSPRATEKVTPIDPEPLLDEYMKMQQQPPPPPPVPTQPQQQQPPPPQPPAPPQQRLPQQVAETVKPDNEQEPNNARLLSEYNVTVDKQKVNRGARNEPMVSKAKPEELTPKKDPKEDPSVKEKPPEKPPGQDKAPEAPGKLAMRKPGAPAPSEAPQDARHKGAQNTKDGPLVADGFVPRKGDGAIEQSKKDPGELTKGQGGAGGGAPPVPDLKPSKDVLERVLGGGSVDHLEDVENGDETALNAKRWVYASFFNRLKRQVAMNWDPQTVWRRSDPDGSHYGFKTRVTEVRVSLSAKGDLAKIVVTNPSGSTELDEEALRAFRKAAPFPNPPDGLVQKDNLITFAFSFYFEIGQSRTAWHYNSR